MFSLYLVLKYIHILAAITAVGANITYGVWNVRSAQNPAHLGFALKGIKFIDDRIANPAYGVLLLTGLLMILVGNLGLRLWIILALVLFAALVVVAIVFYSPMLVNQIRLVDSGDTSSAEFQKFANRNRALGIGLGVLVALILIMMVFQPSL